MIKKITNWFKKQKQWYEDQKVIESDIIRLYGEYNIENYCKYFSRYETIKIGTQTWIVK